MQQKNNNKKDTASEIYDLYAPALYGKILSIVHKGPIANKILEKVFVDVAADKNMPVALQPPLISLLNHSREKSYQVLNALHLFSECCAGSSVHITDKK